MYSSCIFPVLGQFFNRLENCKKPEIQYVFQINEFVVDAPSSLHSLGRIWDIRDNTQLLMSSCCFGSQQNHLIDFMDRIQVSQAHQPNH